MGRLQSATEKMKIWLRDLGSYHRAALFTAPRPLLLFPLPLPDGHAPTPVLMPMPPLYLSKAQHHARMTNVTQNTRVNGDERPCDEE